MRVRLTKGLRGGWTAIVLTACLGCGDKSLSELTESVQQQVEQASEQVRGAVEQQVDQAQAQLGLAGQFNLQLGEPLRLAGALAFFEPPAEGRAGALLVKSYRKLPEMTYPAVFLQCELSTATLAEAVGGSVQADVYVQLEPDGPIWASAPEAPVEARLASLSDGELQLEFVAGELVHSDTGARQALGGGATAAVQ